MSALEQAIAEHSPSHVFALFMDEIVPGAEDWDNEVHWYPTYGDEPLRDLVVL